MITIIAVRARFSVNYKDTAPPIPLQGLRGVHGLMIPGSLRAHHIDHKAVCAWEAIGYHNINFGGKTRLFSGNSFSLSEIQHFSTSHISVTFKPRWEEGSTAVASALQDPFASSSQDFLIRQMRSIQGLGRCFKGKKDVDDFTTRAVTLHSHSNLMSFKDIRGPSSSVGLNNRFFPSSGDFYILTPTAGAVLV